MNTHDDSNAQLLTASKALTIAMGAQLEGWTVDLPGRAVISPAGTVKIACDDHQMITFSDLDGSRRTVQFRRGATFGAIATIARAVAMLSDDVIAATYASNDVADDDDDDAGMYGRV